MFQIATDVVLKTTFSFCLDSLPIKQKSIDSSEITSLFQNVAFVEPNLTDSESGNVVSSSAFFNLRGFVVHNFNEDYGLVQTPGTFVSSKVATFFVGLPSCFVVVYSSFLKAA
jgi:hypothetical protein